MSLGVHHTLLSLGKLVAIQSGARCEREKDPGSLRRKSLHRFLGASKPLACALASRTAGSTVCSRDAELAAGAITSYLVSSVLSYLSQLAFATGAGRPNGAAGAGHEKNEQRNEQGEKLR